MWLLRKVLQPMGVVEAMELLVSKVTETGSGSCQVDWQSTFEPVGSVDEAEKMIRGVYTGGVAGVRKALGV